MGPTQRHRRHLTFSRRAAWPARGTSLALLLALCAAVPVSAQTQSTPPATSPAATQVDAATAQRQRQLQVFGPILLNPSGDIDAETRRNAATELLDMHVPEALDVMRQALQSRKPVVTLAAISALQSQGEPPPALLDAVCSSLETASAEVLPSLAALLARYGDTASSRVSDLALRPTASAPARLNAIAALGAFRSREVAATLMRVVQSAPNGPAPLLDPAGSEFLRGAIASLERMTGLTYGQDVAAWQAWWARAAGDTPEQWYRLISDSQANRAAMLQQQLQEQRQTNELTSRELFSTYRDLYPALPIDEQLRRLPLLLQHKLAPVRAFGLSRVGVLARDSVRMPPEVVALLRGEINDDAPELRQAAASLLDELNDEHTAEVIIARLNVESSPLVVSTLLAVLGRRPTMAAVEPVLHRLDDAAVADDAADALWGMLQALVLSAETASKVHEAALAAARRHRSPETLRLAAMQSDDRDIADLTAILDSDDRRLRAAVAEGFWKRGLRQPLVDRADDEAVYPFAIRAVADGPADLANFNVLAGMKPNEANRRLWCEMIVRLASRLQPGDLPTADDALRNIAYADAALRRDALLGAAALPRDTLPAADRLRIVERLAPLLIDLGDATRAWDILEGLSAQNAAAASLRVVQFQAAALTGHFDRAAQIQPEPLAWITLLGHEMERSNPACPRLYDEIVRRFGSGLDQQDQQRLNAIGAALHAGPTG